MIDTIDMIEVHPLTSDRWRDLEKLFGPNGACGGCWCMWWRMSAREFDDAPAEAKRDMLHGLVDNGSAPGLVAYVGDKPIGWCTIGKRGEFSRLKRSRVLKPVDDADVWAVPCFFIHRNYRGRGVARALLDAAITEVSRRGGVALEGFPVVRAGEGRISNGDAYTGVPSLFAAAGFEEIERRGSRAIVRMRITS